MVNDRTFAYVTKLTSSTQLKCIGGKNWVISSGSWMDIQHDLHVNLENMSNFSKKTSFCQRPVLFCTKTKRPIVEKTEAYLELSRTSTMKLFCDEPLTLFG